MHFYVGHKYVFPNYIEKTQLLKKRKHNYWQSQRIFTISTPPHIPHPHWITERHAVAKEAHFSRWQWFLLLRSWSLHGCRYMSRNLLIASGNSHPVDYLAFPPDGVIGFCCLQDGQRWNTFVWEKTSWYTLWASWNFEFGDLHLQKWKKSNHRSDKVQVRGPRTCISRDFWITLIPVPVNLFYSYGNLPWKLWVCTKPRVKKVLLGEKKKHPSQLKKPVVVFLSHCIVCHGLIIY